MDWKSEELLILSFLSFVFKYQLFVEWRHLGTPKSPCGDSEIPGSSKRIKFVPFHPQNLPKDRNFTYMEDPGMKSCIRFMCVFVCFSSFLLGKLINGAPFWIGIPSQGTRKEPTGPKAMVGNTLPFNQLPACLCLGFKQDIGRCWSFIMDQVWTWLAARVFQKKHPKKKGRMRWKIGGCFCWWVFWLAEFAWPLLKSKDPAGNHQIIQDSVGTKPPCH